MIWNNGDIITENKYNRLKRFGGNYPQSIKLEVITDGDGINVPQQPYINMSYDQLLNLVKDGNIIYITITEVTQQHTYTNIFYLMYSDQSVKRISPLRISVSCIAKAADKQWWVCPPFFAAYFR